MSKFVLKDASIVVNSVNLSDHADSVTIESTFDVVEVNSFGTSNYKQKLQALGDATITVHFYQDFAGGSVNATLWPLSQSGASFPVVVKPTSAAVSATNPTFTMTAILASFNPLDGAIGDPSGTDATFENSGATGIVMATS